MRVERSLERNAMSDLDDLKQLEEMLAAGKISQQEYNNERAWILGSAAEEAQASASPAHKVSGSHTIDLHEIEVEEAPAAEDAKSAPQHDARSHSTTDKPRKRIPTVWKAIIIAFLVWILLLATAVVYLRIRNVNAGTRQITVGAQTQAGSTTAQTAAQELQENAAEASYDAFVVQLETTLGTYYGSNYSVTDDGKTLTISLTGDGIAADAVYVVQGTAGAAELWSELKESMRTLAVTCFDGANAEAAERHVVLNILNDQNQENVILSYLDGQCIYDATETTDLSE